MRFFKNLFHAVWLMHRNIRHSIRFSTWCYERVPGIGRFLAMFIDRTLVWRYGLEVTSHRVKVAHLHIPHPVGVLLGGNGIVSEGRVAVMSGAKFVGRAPDDPEYLARAKTGDVFRLGDNVMIGTNSVIVGPVEICDNVVIGSMSLVNKSITEPGVYVGSPVKKLDLPVPGDTWVSGG